MKAYIKDESCIATHVFIPFIHREIKKRRFRRQKNEDGTRTKRRFASEKVRGIFYPSHIDANIYRYYAHQLESQYEERLKEHGLTDIPTAYRRLPLLVNGRRCRNKCSIDHAGEIFNWIKTREEKELVVIAFDVKGFFDNLDHDRIKASWVEVMGFSDGLPDDHLNLFKSLTDISYVEEHELFEVFKDRIIVQKKSGVIRHQTIKKKTYMRNKNAIAFCDETDFLVKKELVKKNVGTGRGIPQGASISLVLSNMYMMDFDIKLNRLIQSLGGIYRRYCDDILVVSSKENEHQIFEFIQNEIHACNLEIQNKKTQVFHFLKRQGRFYCFEKNINTGQLQTNTIFEYLGFAFDGRHVLLRSDILASYYRMMKRTIKRSQFFNQYEKTKKPILKSKLYKRFTHRGIQQKEYKPDAPLNWTNFLSYAYLASQILPENKIKGQLKNHWKIFNQEMAAQNFV